MAFIAVLLAACGDDDQGPGGGSDAGDSGMMPMDSGTPPGALADNTAGKACSGDTECGSGMCAMQIAGGGVLSTVAAAPGGYCTAPCMTDAQCGAGGACLDDLADLDTADMQCYATCATKADCREGYACSAGISLATLTMVSTCRPAPDTDKLDNGVVGDECTDAADCPGGMCLTATPGVVMGIGSMPLPGGYCSGRCLEAADCGEGGACVLPLAGLGAGAGTCYLGCTTDDDCSRDGYRCRDLGGMRGCSPAADPLPDDTAGKACSADADCGGNMGSCATQLPGPGLQGIAMPVIAPDGYCSQSCMEASDCGAGGACVVGTCYQACADVSDCRDGYTCEMRGLMGIPGAPPPQMVCAPGTPPVDVDAGP